MVTSKKTVSASHTYFGSQCTREARGVFRLCKGLWSLGVWGQKSPSGVQGQSLGMGSGGRSYAFL